jgi:DNA repair exonuclease SbcCD nuclease subunit
MESELSGANPPRFFYHLGDVIYFNGEISEYYSQFYEPYAHYTAPIIALAGNHDGDPINSSQTSLDGWVRYFMTSAPVVNPESQDAPRATMQQPNVFFTLLSPFATIVGMYTNVPEHGSIDSVQQQWLTNEFATADPNKALLVALHHPVYSFDNYHSGSPRMADAVQHAINDSRRVPNMVLTGHVHNYQRIERSLVDGAPTPFIVSGNGGYHNLHHINLDPNQLPVQDPNTQASLIAFNQTSHGYITLTIDADHISGKVTTVDQGNNPGQAAADTFQYPAKAVHPTDSVTVSL